MVGTIQDEEAFSRHSCTKMLAQKGQHLTSGFDLGHQRAAVLGKPGEAFEQMGLVGHRPGGDDHIVHPLVGEHFQNLRAHLIAKAQKGQQGNLLLLQIGQKAQLDDAQGIPSQFCRDAVQHPLGFVPLGRDQNGVQQSRLGLMLRCDGQGIFPLINRPKDTAQQPLKAAVVIINQICPVIHFCTSSMVGSKRDSCSPCCRESSAESDSSARKMA